MRVLITGNAGFIGFHLTKVLAQRGFDIIGIDNINNYYDTSLKFERLKILGIDNPKEDSPTISSIYPSLIFYKSNIENETIINQLFSEKKPELVINLAAQAGVRFSITNPESYITSNINGFFNILNACKKFGVDKLIYASSSSIYGDQKESPFSEDMQSDKPISLYAVTKKTNELMAYCYSHLFGINSVGLRFFTVYGPYGRPDMAYFSFAKAITEQREIEVFNGGDLSRDFTYIDDIIGGILAIIDNLITECSLEKYEIFNIGNSSPVKLMEFISTLENCLEQKAILKMSPMQPGDVHDTFASVDKLQSKINYAPSTSLEVGIKCFTEWFNKYNNGKEN